ncbi:MAG: hypothetical protein U5R49_25270 [Deltaproteobacteria bacterium]|nr:hypothetical protein [Deltaproteobacteria bacterium]
MERADFKDFERMAGVPLRDLISEDARQVRATQTRLVEKSVILNEIQKLHFGYGFPLFVYTHSFELFEPVASHQREVDETILAISMGDSLRRRHMALSHAIVPKVVDDLYETLGLSLTVKNLGSGVGLDTLHAAVKADGKVARVINYDTDHAAVDLGEKTVKYLEAEGYLKTDTVNYFRKSLTKSVETADLIIQIGVICGLHDPVAQMLIAGDYKQLNEGGKLIISSSNEEMRDRDPLGSFLIQHIGTREDAKKGWGLNFRKRETLFQLLSNAGFSDIRIYDDSNYPGKEDLPEEVLYGVETLPSQALGHDHNGKPIRLPPKDVLNQNIGYNWIAVATK